ncbi:hypothetical protein CLFO_05970 [Clostridium formicaceticum]|nr:hypothetical protein CLFO_05970 [Clostridium formicaceticum]
MLLLLTSTNLCYATDNLNQYEILGKSYDGFRTAMNSNGLLGYVDNEGNPLTPFIYDGAGNFNNGVGIVYTEDENSREYSAIDTKGEILKFKKELGTVDFYNGRYGIVSVPSNNPSLPIKSALIDSKGNLVTDYFYDGIYMVNGRSTGKGGVFLVNKNGYWGAIKGDGTVVIPAEYDNIQCYSEQSNVFMVSKKEGSSYKYGYIRFDGKILFECKYDGVGDFTNGYGLLDQSGKIAIVDINGNFLTDFVKHAIVDVNGSIFTDLEKYDEIYEFNEGLAVVKSAAGYGCIDQKGNLVIPCKYSSMDFSKNGYFRAILQSNNTEVTLKNPLIDQREINVYINDRWLYLDQEPIIENGRTLAPFRTISEALGYAVEWDNTNQSITLQNSEKIICLQIGLNEASVDIFDDGKKAETILLDVPPKLINGRTFVPVRFLSDNIGAKIVWNQDTKTIQIQNDDLQLKVTPLVQTKVTP